jgi:Zn-dependent protease with chaperone function
VSTHPFFSVSSAPPVGRLARGDRSRLPFSRGWSGGWWIMRLRLCGEAAWASIARNLLIVFIVAHHALLLMGIVRTIEEAWLLGLRLNSPSATVATWAGALAWASLALVMSLRLRTALPELVTAAHDAADEEVRGDKLVPDEHPGLFDAVRDVARRVGAPAPDEIWITADARCFALEQRRFGVTTQRVLVLALGLPHLLVLSAAELQVIVAHELTHIRQKDTTLAVFFFRFSQSLRTYIDRANAARLGWLNPVAWIELTSYWLVQALIAPVQRRQEILADCLSAQVLGGDLARRTLLKDWLVTLQFASLVEKRLSDSQSRIMPDRRTLHQQFAEEWREISAAGREYLRQRLDEMEEESYWDSHPTLSSRLRAVAAYPNFGIQDHQPAMALLGDSDAMIRQLSEEMIGQLEGRANELAAAN